MAERAPQANQPENQGTGRFEALRKRAMGWLSRLVSRREVTLPESVRESVQTAPDSVWSSEGHPDWVIQEPKRLPKRGGPTVLPAGAVLTADGWKSHTEFQRSFSTEFVPDSGPKQPDNPTMGRAEVPGLADRFVTARVGHNPEASAWDEKPTTLGDLISADLESGAQLPQAVLGVEGEPTGFQAGGARARHAQHLARAVSPVIRHP